jgi:hypothetical protein
MMVALEISDRTRQIPAGTSGRDARRSMAANADLRVRDRPHSTRRAGNLGDEMVSTGGFGFLS